MVNTIAMEGRTIARNRAGESGFETLRFHFGQDGTRLADRYRTVSTKNRKVAFTPSSRKTGCKAHERLGEKPRPV